MMVSFHLLILVLDSQKSVINHYTCQEARGKKTKKNSFWFIILIKKYEVTTVLDVGSLNPEKYSKETHRTQVGTQKPST